MNNVYSGLKDTPELRLLEHILCHHMWSTVKSLEMIKQLITATSKIEPHLR